MATDPRSLSFVARARQQFLALYIAARPAGFVRASQPVRFKEVASTVPSSAESDSRKRGEDFLSSFRRLSFLWPRAPPIKLSSLPVRPEAGQRASRVRTKGLAEKISIIKSAIPRRASERKNKGLAGFAASAGRRRPRAADRRPCAAGALPSLRLLLLTLRPALYLPAPARRDFVLTRTLSERATQLPPREPRRSAGASLRRDGRLSPACLPSAHCHMRNHSRNSCCKRPLTVLLSRFSLSNQPTDRPAGKLTTE